MMTSRSIIWRTAGAALALCLLGSGLAAAKAKPRAKAVPTPLQRTAQEYRRSIQENQSQIEKLKKKISEAQNRLKRTRSEEQRVLEEIEENKLSLEFIRKELSLYRLEIKETDQVIIGYRTQLEEARQAEQRTSLLLREHLRMIYKQNLRGTGSFLLSSQDFSVFLKRLKFLRIVALQSSELLHTVQAKQAYAASLLENWAESKKHKLEIARMTREKEKDQEKQRKRRSLLLGKLHKQATRYSNEVEYNQRASKNLQALIGNLNAMAKKAERDARQRYTFTGGTGKLPWPVKGPIVTRFGKQVNKQLKTTQNNQGIEIRVAVGTPVKVLSRGRVLYADWLTGYGKMVIVDHGSNFWSLYAHLDEISVRETQDLADGAQVGLSGETGSMNGATLYLQVRKNGLPQDPLRWLAKK